jgi:demethylmenaquinone methyltransferase/2-methoxy-6-polyprenyl-1,4-benzoquinol methylase
MREVIPQRDEARVAYVRAMFGRIAHRYVLANSLMTLGLDRRWRRYAVRQANLDPGARLLDMGTGTGDMALEAISSGGSLTVVGADFTQAMMRVGRQRPGGERVLWCAADALVLPFPDSTFDAVVSGFLMRNVINIEAAFVEQRRVVRPGGRIVCLDTSPPSRNGLRPFILLYMRLLGTLVSGGDSAYTYLSETTQRFKTPNELEEIMKRAGLQDVHHRRFMFNSIAVHVGIRPPEEP